MLEIGSGIDLGCPSLSLSLLPSGKLVACCAANATLFSVSNWALLLRLCNMTHLLSFAAFGCSVIRTSDSHSAIMLVRFYLPFSSFPANFEAQKYTGELR